MNEEAVLTEVHQVHRILDREGREFLLYCREPDCLFARLVDAMTLDVKWSRPGAPDVAHTGGNGGLQMGVVVRRKEVPE